MPFLLLLLKEAQVLKVKTANNVKLHELDNQIQAKLTQAQTRKDQLEQEQLEKLKRNVSSSLFALYYFGHKPFSFIMQSFYGYKKKIGVYAWFFWCGDTCRTRN